MLICIQLLLTGVAGKKNQAQFLKQQEYAFSSILILWF